MLPLCFGIPPTPLVTRLSVTVPACNLHHLISCQFIPCLTESLTLFRAISLKLLHPLLSAFESNFHLPECDSMIWPNYSPSRRSTNHGGGEKNEVKYEALWQTGPLCALFCTLMLFAFSRSARFPIKIYSNLWKLPPEILLLLSLSLCLIHPCLGSIKTGSKYHKFITGFCS